MTDAKINLSAYAIDVSRKPEVTAFFDAATNTFSYVVRDLASSACAIIDPVLDLDYAAGRIATVSADAMAQFVRANGLDLQWLIETHVHADHLSAAPYLQAELGGEIGIGENIVVVQETFGKVFNEGTEFRRDGSQFDRLFGDGDRYMIGELAVTVIHTPGHTPACMTHIAGNAAFIGDTLFMPDGGTARADFPGGDAHQLYRSICKLLALPAEMRLFICHDYGPGGREFRHSTTVAEERAHNIHVRDGISEAEFVAMRQARDATLDMPTLIIPSLQVNMKAGELPEPEDNGTRYLKVPLNLL
ncbi:MBL-fold metallo-hydrolase superfamily [hydrothermal vent metagenome]|uniref:MBL-fold metallo-hydrolase superfamily n=1 Tax=hydrothermal vent metagenome TaxID=652676 RepID=A0A3B0U8F4_9ZZZZ